MLSTNFSSIYQFCQDNKFGLNILHFGFTSFSEKVKAFKLNLVVHHYTFSNAIVMIILPFYSYKWQSSSTIKVFFLLLLLCMHSPIIKLISGPPTLHTLQESHFSIYTSHWPMSPMSHCNHPFHWGIPLNTWTCSRSSQTNSNQPPSPPSSTAQPKRTHA